MERKNNQDIQGNQDKKDYKDNKDFSEVFESFKNDDPQIEYFSKPLGKGAYGEVREVKLSNSSKVMAAKLILKDKKENSKEIIVAQELRGNNIIKINKTISKEFKGEEYDLIIMEKALLRDLGKLTEFYFHHNLLKLIYDPFDEIIGNNFLRFYARQIIDGLELLDRKNFVHFDIKPENLLITINLNIKISDFSLLTKVNDGEKVKIPGGTQGYLTEEYFRKEKVSSDVARKQDYFALGSTLFYLKFGEPLINYQQFDEPMINADRIVDILHKKIAFIQSRKVIEQGLIDFLKSLIEYKPADRPTFEKIFRNKWLNKNREIIDLIAYANENDEEKVIMELQKSDFLINKQKNKKGKNFKFVKKK